MYEKYSEYDNTLEAIKSIKKKIESLKNKLQKLSCFLGFDGYIDYLYSLCQSRESATEWTKMKNMKTFGALITNVAGSSANIERILKRKISGGFAPNSCKAINGIGVKVYLIAALGYPNINEAFTPLINKDSIDAISFSKPGKTLALEFDDGKIMLTDFENILKINWDLLIKQVKLKTIIEKIETSDIMGFGYWSLIPEIEEMWAHFLYDVFPNVNNFSDITEFIVYLRFLLT